MENCITVFGYLKRAVPLARRNRQPVQHCGAKKEIKKIALYFILLKIIFLIEIFRDNNNLDNHLKKK